MHHAEVGFLELFLVAQGQLMGITLKAAGQKRMDNSAEENERHCQVETAGLFVAFTKQMCIRDSPSLVKIPAELM